MPPVPPHQHEAQQAAKQDSSEHRQDRQAERSQKEIQDRLLLLGLLDDGDDERIVLLKKHDWGRLRRPVLSFTAAHL